MTQEIYDLEHRVFAGGRYLRAFDHLADIDHFEHSILVYIGSLMPFNKGFVRTCAFPSVATISRSTKISESTVRKKIRSLEKKGLIETESVKYLNHRGRCHQSSNNYSLTNSAFDQFEITLRSMEMVDRKARRSSKHTSKQAIDTHHPLLRYDETPGPSEPPSLCETVPKSSVDDLKIENLKPVSSSASESPFLAKQAADRIIEAWEEEFHKPVSMNEQERFRREFIRVRANEFWMLERIAIIASDPYLTCRAKSVNFLFSGLDFALKDKSTITQRVDKALAESRSKDDLESVLVQIPEYVAKHSKGFFGGSIALAYQLVDEPVAKTRRRLGIKTAGAEIKDQESLRSAIVKSLDNQTNQYIEKSMIFRYMVSYMTKNKSKNDRSNETYIAGCSTNKLIRLHKDLEIQI